MSQGDGPPDAHEVPVIGAGLNDGAHAALQRDLGQDVVPQIAQHAAGVGQLSAAQVDKLEDLLPAGDERVVHAEGLARRGGRRGGVVHSVWELLLQLQIVQDEAVAVVGYAQAVRGLAVGGCGEVGADPGGQPGACVGAFRQRQQGAELFDDGVQLVLVAQPPAAEELQVHPHRCADEPQLLGAHPGADLHVPASDKNCPGHREACRAAGYLRSRPG